MDGKVRKKETLELNAGVGGYSGPWPERIQSE